MTEISLNPFIAILISLLLLFGTFFILSTSIGLIRLPDVYTRSHAASKGATLGIASILLGAFLYFLFAHGELSTSLLLGIIFVLLTLPVSGHMIARAAYNSGVPLWDKSVQNELDQKQKRREKV
ncbi:multicomponent Na+:H+ antiporter subunit G [Bacillus mesophilus]|uniref:Na+/H+ antiporter subunit G n=1 Tax=Bacillus mesophilus TaxID=1808955 RepID=A0A6M0Q5Z1_9BACI|nr:monovalent cation/H(+) antiporter subunit G [Bacillus mesophilus]MBM7660749.1 multicomponent Na+:H+ antiporter subunit G [Bacillus mesophilus]NEY71704.1 Na+/H+ antiporter subunit G [Bacillus mesophilus]